MFRNVFLYLLFVHTLGDFYFQSENLSIEKEHSFPSLLNHCFIYALSSSLLIILIVDEWVKIVVLVISFLHFLVDFVKYLFLNNTRFKKNTKKENKIYAVDQIVHLLTFIAISLIITQNNPSINQYDIVDKTFELMNLPLEQFIKWLLILLLIGKPANVTIKKLLSPFKPSSSPSGEATPFDELKLAKMESEIAITNKETVRLDGKLYSNEIRAGALIGFLERFIMLVFLSINQYSAIGLVLTAKSIARYDKISKDQAFAEYYLLGTLFSTLLVIVLYFITIHHH